MVSLYNCFRFNEEWYLVEMALAIPPEEIPFDQFVVPEEEVAESDWQTVFAEQFLNSDGTERICELYETPGIGDATSRIAFFIYKTDAHTLRTPYGQFTLSSAEQVPNRLKAILVFDEDNQ